MPSRTARSRRSSTRGSTWSSTAPWPSRPRDVPLAARPRRADGRIGRLGEPDDARPARVAVAVSRRSGRRADADAEDVATHTELSRLYDEKLDTVRRLHDAGVRLMAGSDSARRGTPGRATAGSRCTRSRTPGCPRPKRWSREPRVRRRRSPSARPSAGWPRDVMRTSWSCPATRSRHLNLLGRPLDVFLAGRRVRRLAAE